MVARRRRKNSRYRGSRSHSWGAKKKHRGAGTRTGRGMAGSGKHGDHKRISVLKEFGHAYYGKHGFTRSRQAVRVNAINIRDLPDTPEVNLTSLGYGKLLANGVPRRKYAIIVAQCSAKAKEKIEKVGGTIVSGDHGSA